MAHRHNWKIISTKCVSLDANQFYTLYLSLRVLHTQPMHRAAYVPLPFAVSSELSWPPCRRYGRSLSRWGCWSPGGSQTSWACTAGGRPPGWRPHPASPRPRSFRERTTWRMKDQLHFLSPFVRRVFLESSTELHQQISIRHGLTWTCNHLDVQQFHKLMSHVCFTINTK